MTEVLWPLDLCPSSQTWNIIGNAATFTSPLSGATRTYGRPGSRLGCTLTFPPMRGAKRARLQTFINTLLDRSNRAWVPDFSTARRGTFPTGEILPNNDFRNGTSGWSGGSGGSLSVSNGVARITRTVGTAEMDIVRSSAPAAVQYAPYVGRGFISTVSTPRLSGGLYMSSGSADFTAYEPQLMQGMKIARLATLTTSINTYLYDSGAGGAMAGDFFESPYLSLSRGAAVDGGGNYMLYSDQINNAAWTKTRVSVTENGANGPNGEAVADLIVEDSSNNNHFISQSYTRVSAAEDWCAFGYFARGSGTRNVLLQIASTAGLASYAYAYFNLGAGTVSTMGTFGSATNARAYIAPMGGGWYYCAVVGRLPASTTAFVKYALSDSTPSETYAGNGTSSIAAWRCGAVPSSFPVTPSQTTAAVVAPSQQTTPGIYIKGLPANTQGLLEAGDPVQIGGQLNFVTARLNSDSAGRGFLQCGRPWYGAANNTPVIVHQPMCKMILATDTIDLETLPGRFSPFQIELVEAIE